MCWRKRWGLKFFLWGSSADGVVGAKVGLVAGSATGSTLRAGVATLRGGALGGVEGGEMVGRTILRESTRVNKYCCCVGSMIKSELGVWRCCMIVLADSRR
jgi:hypothetical protein